MVKKAINTQKKLLANDFLVLKTIKVERGGGMGCKIALTCYAVSDILRTLFHGGVYA